MLVAWGDGNRLTVGVVVCLAGGHAGHVGTATMGSMPNTWMFRHLYESLSLICRGEGGGERV